MSPKQPKLKLIPLGGLGEVGKNMLVMECGQDMLLIDAGLMFPEEEMLGIDLVLPNFNYVKQNQEKLKAIVITHGHEDHTGALPYLLKEIKKVPVYGTKLTLGLIKGKLDEYRVKKIDLREIRLSKKVSVGCFELEFMRVCHSIPDGVGMAITTPYGIIIHSGDFKLDRNPIDGRTTDFGKFASFKQKGVLALLSDSTNAELSGYTLPERTVGERLAKIFTQAQRRVIVASFSSHIHRIQQVVDIAANAGRRIAIAGRNMKENVKIAADLGFLDIPQDLLVDIYEINRHPPSELAVLCTGSQGEPLSALAKMASRDYHWLEIAPGDTVIVSARPVPGNERAIYRVINELYKCGAEVHYESISSVHVSGHAAQEELKMMLDLVSPKYFIPIHGEYRHLVHNARLAKEMGVAGENIFVVKNGDVVEFTKTRARVDGEVESGMILVDGLGVGDVGSIVLRDRQLLSRDGIFIVVVTVNVRNGALVAGPDVISRGFVHVRESQKLLDEAKEQVVKCLKRTAKEHITEWSVLKNDVRRALGDFLYEKTRRRPIIIPIIMEI